MALKKNKIKKGQLKMSSVDEEDDRFKAIAYDPRFQRFPRQKSKVQVDDRFKDMFDNPDYHVGSSKDKRGRKGTSKKDEVRRYYRLEEDGDKDEASEGEEEELNEDDLRALRMRGLAGSSSSSSSESESDDGSEEDVDNELVQGILDEDIEALYDEWGVGAYAANPNEDVPMLEDATNRLACVDMDWENVKAVDILAVLKSFVPDGGRIVSVTVYPSDYGLEKMEEEKTSGPKRIYKKVSSEGTESEDSDGEDGAIDASKLRYYERSKLRWFYAIIVCSNIKTAESIYTECDGMEYMKTANVFDLRFVPEGQSFDGRQVRDVATDLPADYVAPTFQTKALQHTNVELTWDKVDGERKKTLSRKLNADDLKDEDFKTYLASASEDSDQDNDLIPEDDPEAVRMRYQSLLGANEVSGAAERQGKKEWGGADVDNDQAHLGSVPDKDMELQVTFEQDLETLGEKLSTKAKEKRLKGSETVWDAYVRRRKEKREEARRKGRVNYHSSDDEDDFDSDIEQEQEPTGNRENGDVDPFDDPFFSQNDTFKDKDPSGKQPKSKKNSADKVDLFDDERRQAELEMILMDEESLGRSAKKRVRSAPGDMSVQKLTKKERMKLAKLKKRAEREDGSDSDDIDAMNKDYLDMKDPRFQDVFENPEFALDPTDPRFVKAGKGVSKLATEAARRRSQSKKSKRSLMMNGAPGNGEADVERSAEGQQRGAPGMGKADLKLMVASLKRKSGKS
jgi:hypothetical protein